MADTKICPYCFETIKSQAIRCKHCHANLADAPDTGSTYGGLGGVTIGGSHHKIEGGIHIVTTLGELNGIDVGTKRQLKRTYEEQIRNFPESSKLYLALGLNYLDLKMYDLAIETLGVVQRKNPRNADILYYTALANIKGRRPKILKLSEIRLIESQLRAAIELDESQSHYTYLWAILKYDYYLVNGLKIPLPSIDELLFGASKREVNSDEIRQMFKHISVPNNPITEIILGRL